MMKPPTYWTEGSTFTRAKGAITDPEKGCPFFVPVMVTGSLEVKTKMAVLPWLLSGPVEQLSASKLPPREKTQTRFPSAVVVSRSRSANCSSSLKANGRPCIKTGGRTKRNPLKEVAAIVFT